jgi:hypothetical protein
MWRDSQSSSRKRRVQQQGLEASRDVELIGMLTLVGDDVARTCPIEFALEEFPNVEAAQRVAQQLVAVAFDARIHRNEWSGDYSVMATTRVAPVKSVLIELKERLSSLAEAEGGVFGGWSAALAQGRP